MVKGKLIQGTSYSAPSRVDIDFRTSSQPGPSRNETEGEVNTAYLIWDSQIVDADGDPAEVFMYVSVQWNIWMVS